MLVTRIERSTLLHMSYTVRQAIDTAVKASISTPVFCSAATVAETTKVATGSLDEVVSSAEVLSKASFKSTESKAMGWQSGISSLVRFAGHYPGQSSDFDHVALAEFSVGNQFGSGTLHHDLP